MGIIHLLSSRKTGKHLRAILTMRGEYRFVAKDVDSFFFGEEGHSRALKLLGHGVNKAKYNIPQKIMLPGERVSKLSTINVGDLKNAAISIRDKALRDEIISFCNIFKIFMIGIAHEAKASVWKDERMKWKSECSVCGLMPLSVTQDQAVAAASRHVEKFHSLKLERTAVI